jgi:hypothetical protein
LWPWVLLAGVSVCANSSAGASMPQVSSKLAEDQLFDTTRQTPAAYLRQAYEDHQLLVLSFREHDNERQYRALNALLDQVGQDPRLKYIVLERTRENAPVLEAASVTDMDETRLKQELQQRFVDLDGQSNVTGPVMPGITESVTFDARMSLCYSEWAFTWAHFMPRIRAINATRPADHKLLVTAVDAVSTSLGANLGLESYERDSTTAVLFHGKIWRELQRDTAAKAIAVYNIAHTLLGFTAQRDGRTVAPTFLSMFMLDHPEARPRTALVMIDGGLDGGSEYQFKLTERQRSRTPDQSFGVRTAPFRSVATERGDSVLTSGGRYPTYGQDVQSVATLADMVDGIVWLPESEQPATKGGKEYFPTACADQAP